MKHDALIIFDLVLRPRNYKNEINIIKSKYGINDETCIKNKYFPELVELVKKRKENEYACKS